jgi:16S rRNA (cytosine1402-N4)-methyltransferase
MDIRRIHTPVMLDRCVELLAPALQHDGAILVDATLGMGGHSEAFLERLPNIRLVGLDRDTDALRIAGERLARFGDRVTLVHTVYDAIGEHVQLAVHFDPQCLEHPLGRVPGPLHGGRRGLLQHLHQSS